MTVPDSHPRYASLMARDALVEALDAGYLAPQGLTAHGRGETFDYLLGETTTPPAREATEASACALVAAEHPVISVNGNVAALCPGAVAELQAALDAVVEVNLFHRTDERVQLITDRLEAHGCTDVLGADPEEAIPGLDSARAKVARRGIFTSDCVLVPLEDGDRTEALVATGKRVISVDLNPLSRTARTASINITDNVTRALPNLTEAAEDLAGVPTDELERRAQAFDNPACLGRALTVIQERLQELAQAPETLIPEDAGPSG